MILQLGSLFSSLATGLGGLLRSAVPAAVDIGKQFLVKELTRKARNERSRALAAVAVQALNTPGFSVARIGGTKQPVGGRVQRPTFTAAAFTTAQSPIGNIPLLPVRNGGVNRLDIRANPVVRAFFGAPAPTNGFVARGPAMPNGVRVAGAVGEPKFARDEFGKTIMFVPSPDGSGFISVQQARGQNLSAMKPWWRFNRLESQFEKISPRRMNPFNFRAAKRAGRRVERTLDAIKSLVIIKNKMDRGVSAGGKTVKFKTGKKKKK